MFSWIVAIAVILASLAYGVLALFANGMSDAPTSDNVMPLWPAFVGIIFAITIIVLHYHGVG